MHFSIPDTQEFTDDNGSSYMAYNIHINGTFHCTVRYRQLHNLNEQLKKEFGVGKLPYFPPKKLLPLSSSQLEERRSLLEKYIQTVGQHPELVTAEPMNGFLLSAQQETQNESEQEISLDIFLVNGYKISVTVLSSEPTNLVLEKVCRQINLPDAYVYYFALFLVKKDDDGQMMIFRKLQDFESPYICQKTIPGNLRIVLRKGYWDPGYDLELMTDRVALNLLYVQTVGDIEQGWILCSEETKQQLAALQSKGAKKEYMEVARTLKLYGFIHFRPCICDYPYPGAAVLLSIGNREMNMRMQLGQGQGHDSSGSASASASADVREGNFRVTRMRCWRITTLHNKCRPLQNANEEGSSSSDANGAKPNGANPNGANPQLELSFQYLMTKDRLQWITISSQQAILMSVCLQSMVDELLLKKNGSKRRTPGDGALKGSWSYMKRNGSSYLMSNSQSSSSDGFSSSNSSNGNSMSTPISTTATNGELRSPTKTESGTTSMKRLSDRLSSVSLKCSTSSSKPSSKPCHAGGTPPPQPLVENDAFDGIGDEDL